MKPLIAARWSLLLLVCAGLVSFAQAQQPAEKQQVPLTAGNHVRKLEVNKFERTYLVHVPRDYQPQQPTPVVLALHGALMNGPRMMLYSGLNEKADEAGFIVVYPSGTGKEPVLFWNAGGTPRQWAKEMPDDVAFIESLLDDLATVATVDTKRVFACGMSNGGMMCYRLAAELAPRIAAIAPVAGTIAIEESKPSRPVPVLHFHGKDDKIVAFVKPPQAWMSLVQFQGVDESIQTWVKLNGCQENPTLETISKPDDELKATRKTYAGGREGTEVVLVEIEGAGHTWPGRPALLKVLGKSSLSVSANDLMWEFFQKHPMH